MNNISLCGRLGRDPELSHTTGGKTMCKFSLAAKRNKEEADWFNIVVWEKQAETVAKYAKKGSLVGVTGRVEVRMSDGKTYYNVVANHVEFLDKPTTSKDKEKEEDPLPF